MANPFIQMPDVLSFIGSNGQRVSVPRHLLAPDTLARVESSARGVPSPITGTGGFGIDVNPEGAALPQEMSMPQQAPLRGAPMIDVNPGPTVLYGTNEEGKLDPRIPRPVLASAEEAAPAKKEIPQLPPPSWMPARPPQQGQQKPTGLGEGDSGLSKAFKTQEDAQKAATQAGVDRATEEVAYLKEVGEQQKAMEIERQQMVKRQQEALDKERKDFIKLNDELQKGSQVDPNRYVASQSTGQKMTAVFAMVLGGFGQMATGKNDAINIIDRAIQRDIDLQREAIDNETRRKSMAVQGKQNILGMMRAQFGDEADAQKAAEAAMLGLQETKLKALMANHKSAEVQANGAMLLGQIQEKRATTLNELQARRAQAAMQRESLDLQREEMGLKARAKSMGRELPAGESKTLGDLDAAVKATQGLGKAHNELTGPMSGIYADLPERVKRLFPTTTLQYETKARLAAQTLGVLYEGGKLTETEYQRYKADFVPTAQDSPEQALAKVNEGLAFLNGKRDSIIQSHKAAGFNVSGFDRTVASDDRNQ